VELLAAKPKRGNALIWVAEREKETHTHTHTHTHISLVALSGLFVVELVHLSVLGVEAATRHPLG
jgi:hypothetical protein